MYDNEESVCGIFYNGTPYYFQKNLQGDIIGITDQNGAVKARYSYDAWGVCTIAQDNSEIGIATINPYRYRGYYYDSEIELYYLQSRYYNPVVDRFVNADETEFIYIGNNLWSYADNDPIINIDSMGYFSFARVWISMPLDLLFVWISPYLAPVKTLAKRFAGRALKTKLSTPLLNLIKNVSKIASKVLNAVKNLISKIPIWGKKWASKFNVAKISQSIAGAVTSTIFNFILNLIVPNITIFLSVGGFIAGLLDLLSDNQKIKNSKNSD